MLANEARIDAGPPGIGAESADCAWPELPGLCEEEFVAAGAAADVLVPAWPVAETPLEPPLEPPSAVDRF